MRSIGRRTPFYLLTALAVAACTRWSPLPVVPVQRAFANGAVQDVAVRLFDDSTHWWRIREARLVGDSIVGLSRVGGHLRRATVALDAVERVVVRERDTVVDDTVGQLTGFVAVLAMIAVFAGR